MPIFLPRWSSSTFRFKTPLIVLHPNFTDQHGVLPMMTDQNTETLLFVTLTDRINTLSSVMELIQTLLAEQFSIHLDTKLGRETPEEAARTFLAAVRPLKKFSLILDAFDLAQDDNLTAWVAHLVEQWPRVGHIIICSRYLPTTLLQYPQVKHNITLWPTDESMLLLDYLQRDPEKILLEVYALGLGRILVNGTAIRHWDGILPRLLFFFFIDKGMVTRDEIFSTFWPTLSKREATNVFHVTKRKVNEITGFDATIYGSGFYRISPLLDLHYDVITFAEYVQNSEVASDDDAIQMLESALRLYRGSFLNQQNMPWIVAKRQSLQNIYIDALQALARLYDKREEYTRSLALYLRALAVQPNREDLARGAMLAYKETGMPDHAVKVYHRLAVELQRHFNVSPDPQTTELLENLHPSRKRGTRNT